MFGAEYITKRCTQIQQKKNVKQYAKTGFNTLNKGIKMKKNEKM